MYGQVRLSRGTIASGPPEMIRRLLSQGANPLERREPNSKPLDVSGRKKRVLAVLHGYMPYLAAGSERMIQHLLDALPRDEFDVEIMSFGYADDRPTPVPYVYEGIRVYTGYTVETPPDIIITHHGPGARVTGHLCEEFPEAKVVAVYHNDRFEIPDIQALNADLEVFNTRWVMEALDSEGLVVHPPLEWDRHHVDQTGGSVTMVNLQGNKGVHTFHALAPRFPEVDFLGVIGTHGPQELDLLAPEPNIRIHPVTQDMREVWQQTKVVIMASGYESFGMVAAEAQASGIPVIAHPTPGLVECLGNAGLFMDRDDHDGYERVLRLLLTDRDMYEERSAMASLRGRELVSQTQTELHEFVNRMRSL